MTPPNRLVTISRRERAVADSPLRRVDGLAVVAAVLLIDRNDAASIRMALSKEPRRNLQTILMHCVSITSCNKHRRQACAVITLLLGGTLRRLSSAWVTTRAGEEASNGSAY